MNHEEQGEDVGGLATLLFLGFVCTIGYLLEACWVGLFPFSTSFTGDVFLASPYGLLAICSFALFLLVLGALKASYPRFLILLFIIGGSGFLFFLWVAIF